MKTILTILTLLLISTPAFAQHDHSSHGPVKTITVGIDGMVCDFCARSMEKIFYQEEGVEGVIIDLDKQSMTLEIDEAATITDERIKERVYYAGYKVRDIKR